MFERKQVGAVITDLRVMRDEKQTLWRTVLKDGFLIETRWKTER